MISVCISHTTNIDSNPVKMYMCPGRGKVVCALLLACFMGSLLACPDICQCPGSTNQVTCTNVELTEIPRNLPPAVTSIDLSNNLIHELSQNSLGHLRSVINLKLKENQIETIHDGAFEMMQSLQTLDLSGNKLRTLTQYTFTGAQLTLTHLDLSNNELAELDAAFVEMKELSRLDLRNNRIKSITQFTFRDLSSLRYLLLAGNQISDIDRRAFRNLEKLMYLVLKGNPISEVSRFQFNSDFVSYVDLSECGLTKVPRGLPNSIRYLQLRRNNMTVIQRHSFQDCPYVTILVLDENGITEIQENTFEHMKYLQQLWLNNNKLTSLPNSLPPSLQRLLMDTNRVELFEAVFPENSLIHTLSFMGNNISRIDYNTFYKLPKLKSADFSINKLRHIYGNTFINSLELETVVLSKNPLQYFHSRAFHGLSALETLSLAYIGTSVSMHEDIFDDLTSLKKLDLDASPSVIQTVLGSDRLLTSLVNVHDLSMQSAELSHLTPNFPRLFPNLGVLHVSSTRWHCDTSMIWFRDWLREESVQVVAKEDLKCFSPRVLYDHSIMALEDSDFVPATRPPITPKVTAKLTTFKPITTTTTLAPVSKPAQNSASSSSIATTSTSIEDEDYDKELEEDTFNINLKDLLYDEDVDESEEKYPGFLSPSGTPKSPTEKPMTWDEYFAKSKTPKYQDMLATKLPPDSDESKYNPSGLQNDNLDIQTIAPLPGSLTVAPPSASSSDETEGGSNSTLIIIIATTLATVIIAAVIIALIIYLSRKQTKRSVKKPEQNGGVLYKNGGIKYQNRNDVLYFMPGSGGDGSTTDSLQTTTSREGMSLIPGRDINHEGPLRVYKWEDF